MIPQITKHGRLRSWWHDRVKTECKNGFQSKIRLINHGDNNKEGVVSYELKENGKYGFKLFSNLLTQQELANIKYTTITLLDLDVDVLGKHPCKYHSCWNSITKGHAFLVTTKGVD